MPRQRQTDASNLFFSAPASLCLKPRSYNDMRIVTELIDGWDVEFCEFSAQGLLCVGFAVDEANMLWSFAHAFDEVDQVLLVGVG